MLKLINFMIREQNYAEKSGCREICVNMLKGPDFKRLAGENMFFIW